MERISAKKIAQRVPSLLKVQNPNYDYLRDVFRFVRENLNIEVTTTPKRLPYVPTEDEIKLFYKAVWESHDIVPRLIVKVLLYTGIRVSELINIQLSDVDLTNCRIKINQGKGKKDRVVPFSPEFIRKLRAYSQRYPQKMWINKHLL